MAPSDRLRIAVLGYIVRGPLGGLAWHHLQYVVGLARLRHDVLFLEDSGEDPACYDPSRDATGTDPTFGLRFIADVFDRFGLAARWAYHDAHRTAWHGPAAAEVKHFCSDADVVLNLSGINPLRWGLEERPARVLVDTDPVFTQIRHLTDPTAARQARAHTAFFTFGENIGAASKAPDDGLPWQPTRQPVVMDAWPVTPGRPGGNFTTVMQWDSYRGREYHGRRYGLKSDSFAPLMDLPAVVPAKLEVALGGGSAPYEKLRAHGWRVRTSLEVTTDPWTYQRYIQQSKAEFSVAKHAYVVARTGWFSERSAGYLASGRPVVVQDTGFSDWLAADRGVIPFATADDARAAIEDVTRRYEDHCRAARDVAAGWFDSRIVLPSLLERALRAPSGVAGG
jgi:hypothetical protein